MTSYSQAEVISLLSPYKHALPLSYSKVNTLLACPRMYQKRYIEKIKVDTAPTAVIVVGKFVHKVLELCLLKGKTRGWDPEIIEFKTIWDQVIHQLKVPENEVNMAQRMQAQTEKILNRLVAAIGQNKFCVYPEFMLCVDKSGLVKPTVKWPHRFYWGFIDLYAETQSRKRAIMVDFKSHSKTEEHSARTSNQLGMYAHYLFERNQYLESIQFGGIYLPDENIDLSTQIFRGSTEHTAINDNVFERYHQFIDVLATTDFVPKVSEYCDWCDYTQGCPAQK